MLGLTFVVHMGVLDSFGTLASAVIAAVVMLAFSILSLFVMVFIVDVASGDRQYLACR